MKLMRVLLPRMEYILLVAVFWGIVAGGPRLLNFDGDLPRHLLHGRLILQTGQVGTTDAFSFRTEGFPSFPHEWLSQVLLASAYNWLGLDGVVLLTALVIMLTWGIVCHHAMGSSNSVFAALLVTALGIAASQLHVLPRPHVFTYLAMAVWMVLLENRSRTWWLLPIVMLIWVNMHGMFVLGILTMIVYVVGDFLNQPSRAWLRAGQTRALLLGGGLSVLATVLSPSGPRIWEAILSLGGNDYITSRIPEYQSANFHLPETWPFIILLLLTVIGFARSGQKIAWPHLLLVLAFTGLALYSSRMIPLFALVVAPLTARALSVWWRSEFANRRLLAVEQSIQQINAGANGAVWILAVVLLAAGLLRAGETLDPEGRGNVFDERFFPVQAVAWLERNPPAGQMFNEFDWGGYLLFRLWPEQQIFMDGHTHIYGEALTREYEHVITLAPGWEAILQKYDVRWAILRPNAPLVQALLQAENWGIVYKDSTAVILARR